MFRSFSCGLQVFAFLSMLVSPGAPAIAQDHGNTAEHVMASPAVKYARYYAPYAIQAAAAYAPVAGFDATLGPLQQPALDGSDVRLAVASVPGDEKIASAATKYLQSWQYQFGSEGYLTCYEADPDCLKLIEQDRYTRALSGGPSFQVWGRSRSVQKAGASCSEVSIAFRGSTPALADWITNLSPITGYVADDYYRQLRRNIDAIVKKITRLDCYRAKTQIVSVGHSLGGGLAQFAALANNPARPRIVKVFAFDPSPVTGTSYIEPGTLAQNAGVEIDLIYQNGEALERLRGLSDRWRRLTRRPRPSAPCTRTVEYGVFLPTDAVSLHNMPGLARELVGLTFDEDGEKSYKLPKPHANCPSRYVPPVTDRDPDPMLISSGDVAPARIARAPRGGAPSAFASASGAEADAAAPAGATARIVRTKASRRTSKASDERASDASTPSQPNFIFAWPRS